MTRTEWNDTRDGQINWYSFLSRPRLLSLTPETLGAFEGLSVLVTGAGGSIGSALSMKLASLNLSRLIFLDSSEQALYRLGLRMREQPSGVEQISYLGSVTDSAFLEEVFATHRFDLVFHAAAYKHVPLLERHPIAAIQNNVLGTWALEKCSRTYGVAKTVLLSTDKAADPSSILGATKRIAEQLSLSQGGSALRLANVLGSEGSVVERFLEQISAGLSISITHREAERFFLTSEEAVDLLLSIAVVGKAGKLYAPRLLALHKVVDLANFLRKTFPTTSNSDEISFTGLRPGDKLREALCSSTGQMYDSNVNGCYEVNEPAPDENLLMDSLSDLRKACDDRDGVAAMRIVCELVPGYTPTKTALEAAHAVHRFNSVTASRGEV